MQDDFGKLVLRATLAVLILFHGTAKLLTGLAPIVGLLEAHGLPGWLAYGVYAGEVVAPLLVLLGVYARIGAALIVINMLAAVALVHTGQLLGVTAQGGYELELQAFYLFGAVAVFLLGAGRYGLNVGDRWN